MLTLDKSNGYPLAKYNCDITSSKPNNVHTCDNTTSPQRNEILAVAWEQQMFASLQPHSDWCLKRATLVWFSLEEAASLGTANYLREAAALSQLDAILTR